MMKYDLLPWHHSLWQPLLNAWQQNRLPHALLLTGPQGMGKTFFAQRLAGLLLCTQPQPEGKACGQCKSCHLIQVDNHPDISWVGPLQEGKQITIEQIRNLMEFCTLTAQYGRYQIVLINPAEAMNRNASNSLLKLLEEPPAKTLLILISHQPMGLLATIRSRCQRIDFRRLKGTEAWLQNQLPPQLNAQLLLNLTHQAPLAALALVKEEGLVKRKQLLDSLTQQLLNHPQDPISLAEKWNALEDPPQILRWMLSWTMDIIRCAMTGQGLINGDYQETLQHLSKRLNIINVFKLLDLQNETYQIVMGTTHVKPQGLLESIAIMWTDIQQQRRTSL